MHTSTIIVSKGNRVDAKTGSFIGKSVQEFLESVNRGKRETGEEAACSERGRRLIL